MKILKKLTAFFRNMNPRYHLTLDSSYLNHLQNKMIYRLKIYASFSFLSSTFEDIKNDERILHQIHPLDLITISQTEYKHLLHHSKYRVSEILRNNRYKIYNATHQRILSGEEIADDPRLITQMEPADLYRIAFNTAIMRAHQADDPPNMNVIFIENNA